MSDVLLQRARALEGAFTWADATALGLRADELSRLVHRGVVHRVGPRAYVLDEAVRAAAGVEEKHRFKTLAVVRSFDGRVAASHHSSLAVHEAYPGSAITRDQVSGTLTVRPALP